MDQDGMADRDLGVGEQEADRWCQMQDQFLARARQAIEQTRRDGTGISAAELLRRIDERLDAARKSVGDRTVKPI